MYTNLGKPTQIICRWYDPGRDLKRPQIPSSSLMVFIFCGNDKKYDTRLGNK